MSLTMPNKVIFWDFDGVIADTFAQCFTISRLSYPDLTEIEYRQLFEGNINTSAQFRSPARRIDFFAEFEKTIFAAPVTPGIAAVITRLHQTYTNVIISSTITSLIDRYLTQHNLRQHFAAILGNDVAQSKVEKFKMAFTNHQSAPTHAVLVTDTLGDIVEAHEVTLPAIGVMWGFHTKETLARGKPRAIVGHSSELLDIIPRILETTTQPK